MSDLKLPRMITYYGVTDVRAKVAEAILDSFRKALMFLKDVIVVSLRSCAKTDPSARSPSLLE